MDLQDIFVSNLKATRKEKHITQEKLAEMCDTDTAYIGQIETKKRFPSISFIEKIANALNIEPYILFKNKTEASVEQKQKIEKLKSEFLNLLDGDVELFLEKLSMISW
ncbi:helix-turn-helix transcriptional regulator [uncultured Treponema sp.]|uniref:helix-turn-helix domain-containing protein n=1 Tax=uncultured Treponema sp. TaxID=162155 RepID=UPI0025FEBB2E|nr:helix-turn-helix transcriptional regulator [uncultured Treponema sp.]